jgi:hypothetical protein
MKAALMSLFAVLGLCGIVSGQNQIEIPVDEQLQTIIEVVPAPGDTGIAGVVMRLPPPGGVYQLQFMATLWSYPSDTHVSVTNLLQVSVSQQGNQIGWSLPTLSFPFGAEGSVTVSAPWTEPVRLWITSGTTSGSSPGPGAEAAAPPVHADILRAQAWSFLNTIQSTGLPIQEIRTTLASVYFGDGSLFKNSLGYSVIGDNLGLYLPPYAVVPSWTGLWYVPGPQTLAIEQFGPVLGPDHPHYGLVLLSSDLSQEFALGRHIDGSGHLSKAAKTALHELIHATIYRKGIVVPWTFQVSQIKVEHAVIEPMEEIFSEALFIQNQLNNFPDAPIRTTRVNDAITRIRQNLQQIKAAYGSVIMGYGVFVGDVLGVLGWLDTDGNGLPDCIDEMLDRYDYPDPQPCWPHQCPPLP